MMWRRSYQPPAFQLSASRPATHDHRQPTSETIRQLCQQPESCELESYGFFAGVFTGAGAFFTAGTASGAFGGAGPTRSTTTRFIITGLMGRSSRVGTRAIAFTTSRFPH